jgi:hypothetical protein
MTLSIECFHIKNQEKFFNAHPSFKVKGVAMFYPDAITA